MLAWGEWLLAEIGLLGTQLHSWDQLLGLLCVQVSVSAVFTQLFV